MPVNLFAFFCVLKNSTDLLFCVCRQVFAARVDPELGDVLRIFAFDRYNETAFQVDSIIVNGTLFVHPKIFNPGGEIDAYYWTNAGMEFRAVRSNRCSAPN